MKRRVVYLELHDSLFARGVGTLGKVFPSAQKTFDVVITYTDGSPVLEITLEKTRTILTPIALAKTIELGEEIKTNESKTSSK